jgi:hypothetical protein
MSIEKGCFRGTDFKDKEASVATLLRFAAQSSGDLLVVGHEGYLKKVMNWLEVSNGDELNHACGAVFEVGQDSLRLLQKVMLQPT